MKVALAGRLYPESLLREPNGVTRLTGRFYSDTGGWMDVKNVVVDGGGVFTPTGGVRATLVIEPEEDE